MKGRITVVIALVVGACAHSDSPTGPAAAPHAARANAGSVGGGPLAEGACVRDKGKPVAVSFAFAGADGGAATLHITDNGVQGLNGTITLNGATVVTHPMFGGNDPVDLSVPVTTAESNVLICTLEGKPGSGLSFSVTQP